MAVVSTTDVVTNPDTTREVARNASIVCSCFPTGKSFTVVWLPKFSVIG